MNHSHPPAIIDKFSTSLVLSFLPCVFSRLELETLFSGLRSGRVRAAKRWPGAQGYFFPGALMTS